MSQAIKDFISQIVDKDFVAAKSTFEDLLNSRIEDLLDEEEMKVAAKIYNDIDYDDLVAEAKKNDEEDDDEEDDDEDDSSEDNDDDEEEESPKSKKMKEDTQLAELSKKTLGSYIKKANVNSIGHTAGMIGSKDGAERAKIAKKLGRRTSGIAKAADRLAK